MAVIDGIVLYPDYGGGHESMHVLKFIELYSKGKKVEFSIILKIK